MKNEAEKVFEALGDSGRLTVLTGAGISAESGISTFRDSGGLWDQYEIEDVATPEAYAANPSLVQDFYNMRRAHLGTVQPNAGHQALVRLEELLGDRFTLITQNVDDLHDRAGSRRLLHMHGELYKARCVDCGVAVEWRTDISLDDRCESCSGSMRPHIVWFGELPFYLEREIPEACASSAVFFSIGTSGMVYPANTLASQVKACGGFCVEINIEKTAGQGVFDLQIEGKAGETLPLLIAALEVLL